ncbi:hypothetical protein LTR53_009925 [Teratosphaeriaceae sp. CCFEE 6253]|nr:hypothetical protein LTR53_009925 [Teratosphaeriaceae sp. CCFEE 6253]
MIRKWPSGCLHPVSRIRSDRAFIRLTGAYQPPTKRQYAQPSRPDLATANAISKHYSAKAALDQVESGMTSDPVNPPLSTVPPPLDLPERAKAQSAPIYWFRVGRAYGSFYKEGVKAVWYNNKAAKLLQQRVVHENEGRRRDGKADPIESSSSLTRAEWQVCQRRDHDIKKLPLFAVLVLIFGEWLPLFVPFMPGVVPGTCRIPTQVRGMREKAEERRRASFRTANFEPSSEQLQLDDAARRVAASTWPMASPDYIRAFLQPLRQDQLHHLSVTLGLHSSIWERAQLSPPDFIIRPRLVKRLQYLTMDDRLLGQSPPTAKLSHAEVEIACGERGLDVLGRPEAVLRENLEWWLKRQEKDKGQGKAMLSMLFRRPNAWKPVPGDK